MPPLPRPSTFQFQNKNISNNEPEEIGLKETSSTRMQKALTKIISLRDHIRNEFELNISNLSDPDADAEQVQSYGSSDNLAVDMALALELIAEQWFGRPTHGRFSAPTAEPLSPETLISRGSDLGIDVHPVDRALDSLRPSDCPCLIVNTKGSAIIAVHLNEKKSLTCLNEYGLHTISIESLRPDFSGLIFQIKSLWGLEQIRCHESNSPVASVLGLIFSSMLKRQKKALIYLTIASGISNLLLIAVPMFSMAVYDRVLPHMAYETLWALTIGTIIALLADLGLRQVRLRLIDSIAADIGHFIQVRLFKNLLQGKMRDLPRTGGSLAQSIRDLEAYCQLVPIAFLSASVDLPFVLITTIILIGVAGSVAIVPILGGLIIAFAYYIAHIVGHAKLAPYLALARVQSNSIIETIDGIEAVKTAGAESKLLNRWERLADATAFSSHESRLSNGLAAQIAVSLSQVMTVAALVLGVYEISMNAITVGALSASTMLIGRLVSPLTQFVAQAQRLAQAKKTLEPLRIILNATLEVAGDSREEALRPITGHIDFINVGFQYPDAQAPSLESINITIRPGERVGIIGRVGSGKSTLLRMMARLQDPTSGSIRLDGSDYRQVLPRNARKAIVYMKQDTGLFDDTLRANLLFGVDRADPMLIEQAALISGVSILAQKSPEGYGMRAGPRGERLSGGERQALGLARAMIQNPKLLLLEEPTASMDNTIERNIIEGLKTWLDGRGLVIATHRAAMLDLVERVILIDNGKIIADGPKADVLRRLGA